MKELDLRKIEILEITRKEGLKTTYIFRKWF